MRVLHVVSALGGGGVERMLLSYYEGLNERGFTFDFIVHGDKVGELEHRFEALGSTITHVTPKRSSPLDNLREISSVISRGRYDAVHAHQNFSNATTLLLAHLHKVPIRISHAHGVPHMWLGVRVLLQHLIGRSATLLLGCTEEAGRWVHGRVWGPNSRLPVRVMKNAMDLSTFAFSHEIRMAKRLELGISRRRVLLQIGRLSPEKNHAFSFELLSALREDSSAWVLIVAGDGSTGDVLRREAERLGVQEAVQFLGYTPDVSGLMAAADVLLVPSHQEGLGIVAIEAQVSGLHVFASVGLPADIEITALARRLPLVISDWVEAVQNVSDDVRESMCVEAAEAGYDIESAVSKYVSLMRAQVSGAQSVKP